MKVRITKSPDGKGKFVSKLQKFTAQMGGVPQQSSQQQLINFIANDIASGKPKEETIIRLLPILKQDFNTANLYYDQVYQMYSSQKTEDEEEETDEETENNKVQIANNPVMQPVSEQNETKISNDLIAEDRDDSDFDEEIYSDYEDPNAATETQAKLGGNFKKERRKYVNNVLKLAKKKLGGTGEFTQSSTPDPTGEEVRNNMKGSFVNTLKNNAQLAVIKEQAENQFDSYMQDGGQEQPYDFTHYTHGDTDVFHDPMNELVQARLGFNKRRGFRNTPYYMSPFMGLTPDMLQMGMMGPISKLDVTRSHWLTGKPSRYSMEFSPMPGMGMGYYLPGYGYGMKTTGRKTPGRIVTEQISKEVNNNAITEVANTTNSEAASNAAVGPKNWNEADYNNDGIPDYLQPDGAGTEDLAMGRNLPVGPSENPNDPTEKIPTEKVITKPKKKTTAPKTVTPKVTPGVTPPTDPFGIGAGIENLIREGADYLNQGVTQGRDWLEKTARETGWKPDSELIAEAVQKMDGNYDPRKYYGSLGMGPQAAQADDSFWQTGVFGVPNWGINLGKNAASNIVSNATKLLGSGRASLPSGQTMLNSGQKLLNQGQKLLNPPAGYQFKLFQAGGIVNDPFIDPYGNLQKFIYGGNDNFTQADLDYTYSKDTSDPYFQDGGGYDNYAKQIGDRLGMSLRDDLSAKEMYELAQKAGMNNTRTQINTNRNVNPNYFNAGYNRQAFPGVYYDPRLGRRGPGIFPGRVASYAGTWAKPMGMYIPGTNQPYTGMFDPTGISRINVTKSNRHGIPKRYTIDYNVNRDASGKPMINLPTYGSLTSAGSTAAGSNVPKGSDLESTLQRETQGLSGRDLRVKERDIKRAFKQGYGSDYAYDDSRNGAFTSTPTTSTTTPTTAGTGEDKEYIAEFQQKQKDRGLVWNEQQKKWVPNAQNMEAINTATDPNYLNNQKAAGNAMQQMFSNASNLSDYSSSPKQSSAPDVKQQTPNVQTQTINTPVQTNTNSINNNIGSQTEEFCFPGQSCYSLPETMSKDNALFNDLPLILTRYNDKNPNKNFITYNEDNFPLEMDLSKIGVEDVINAINSSPDNNRHSGYGDIKNIEDYAAKWLKFQQDNQRAYGNKNYKELSDSGWDRSDDKEKYTNWLNVSGNADPNDPNNVFTTKPLYNSEYKTKPTFNTPSNPLAAFIQSAIGPNKQNESTSKNAEFNLPSNYNNTSNIEGSQEDLFNQIQQMRANVASQQENETPNETFEFGQDRTYKFPQRVNDPMQYVKGLSTNQSGSKFYNPDYAPFQYGGYFQPGGPVAGENYDMYDPYFYKTYFGEFDAEGRRDEYDQYMKDLMQEQIRKTTPRPSSSVPVKQSSNTSSSVPVDSYQKYITENKNNFKPMSSEELAKAQKAKYEKDVARYSSRNYKSYTDAKNAARTFSDVSTTDDLILRMGNEIDSLREKEMNLLNKPNKTAAEKKQLTELNKKANDLVIKKQEEEAKLKKRVDALVAGKKRFGGTPMAQYGFQTPVTEDDRTKPALDRMQTMSSQDAGRQLLNSQLDAMRQEYGEKPGTVSVDYKNKNMWEVDYSKLPRRINTGLALATGLKDRADTKQIQNQLYNEFYGDAYAPERARIDRGNYDTNSGLFKPDQEGFEGVVRYGGSIYQDGGSIFEDIDEGDEVMMTPEELQEFLANGGEVEYI